MKGFIDSESIPYEQVPWGLTKVLVGPETVGSLYVRVKITEYLPGFTHELHVHPGQEEVVYILSGQGITEIAGERRSIGPGSVLFVAAGSPHGTRNLSPTEPIRAIVIKAPPEDAEVPVEGGEAR